MKLKLFCLFISMVCLLEQGNAQKIVLPKGYYINQKGEAVTGYFDLELFRQNTIRIKASQEDKTLGRMLAVQDVKKIVLEKGDRDSNVFLTTTVTFKGVEERIYLEYLIRGKVNLLRGYSTQEEALFFITSLNYPDMRRINGVHPKTFLMTYFAECQKNEDIKRKLAGEIYYNKEDLVKAITMLADCQSSFPNRNEKNTSFDFRKSFAIGIKAFGSSMKPHVLIDLFEEKLSYASKSVGYGFNVQLNVTNRLVLSTEFESITFKSTATDSVTKKYSGKWDSKFIYKALPVFSFKTLCITPIKAQYNFPKEILTIRPNIAFGFTYTKISAFNFDAKFNYSHREYVDYYPTSWVTGEPPPPPQIYTSYKDNGWSFFAEVGLKKQITERLAINIGTKYNSFKVDFNHNTDVFIDAFQRFDVFGQILFTFK